MTTPSPPLQSKIIEKSPIYYGYVILMAGTVGLIMTTPGQTLGVSVFLDSIIADLALPRSVVSLMYTLGTLSASFALPFVGRFIDRRGPRLAVIAITVLFALACAYMATVNNAVMLFIGFFLIRGLGQGALSLVSIHVINIWFVRRRGLSIGLSGAGNALIGIAFLPGLYELLRQQFDWRVSYLVLAGLLLLIMLPVGATFFRGHPEKFGLQPDSGAVNGVPVNETNYTLQQATRTITFWLFVLGNMSIGALGTGLIFHHYSIMALNGLDRAAASLFFVPLGVLIACFTLISGFLMDRVPPRFLLMTMLACLCSSLAFAPYVTSLPYIFVYGLLFGASMGLNAGIGGSVYAYYFGRQHIGSIKGLTNTIGVVGSAIGPILFSPGEALGSYQLILLVSALWPLSIAVMSPFIKPPHQQQDKQAS